MEQEPKVIKVTDRRGVASASPAGSPSASDPGETSDTKGVSNISPTGLTADSEPLAENRDYLDDLKRLQAEFDNFRKRSRSDQAAAGDRATARVIEGLLPVLDNFELAIAHGEGGEGVQLVFKDLKAALEGLGLEEVSVEGAFDPNVHEAVESREVDGLKEPRIIEVYRRGYLHKGQLLRPAMVVVGRPVDKDQG
ncbi:MAG: molecular chaperone GrpE [Actinomycetota bacterium]|jgi:molecular chaperone GrpE|nr:molecular chaperone GrpE [Actinomycetota bacterium]